VASDREVRLTVIPVIGLLAVITEGLTASSLSLSMVGGWDRDTQETEAQHPPHLVRATDFAHENVATD